MKIRITSQIAMILILCPAAAWSAVVLVDQDRSVSCDAMALSSVGDMFRDDELFADGFEHFQESVSVTSWAGTAHATASADQDSEIDEHGFLAQGSAALEADDDWMEDNACGTGLSTFNVTFQVPTSQEFVLSGSLWAERVSTIGTNMLEARLETSLGEIIWQQEFVNPDQNESVYFSDLLTVGIYELTILAKSTGCSSTQGDTEISCGYDIAVAFEPIVASLDDNGGPVAGSPICRIAPNPFNPRTTISYTIPATTRVRIQVIDFRGRFVATLVDGAVAAGNHEVSWNGRDDCGIDVPSGVYLSRLEAGGQVAHGRMTLVR